MVEIDSSSKAQVSIKSKANNLLKKEERNLLMLQPFLMKKIKERRPNRHKMMKARRLEKNIFVFELLTTTLLVVY